MKIFIDTADIKEIKEANAWGVIDGVTTNPSLVASVKRNYVEVLKEIAKEVDGPISAEVIGLECGKMLKEAKNYAKISDNIVIKVPLIPEGLKAVKILESEGIRTNTTLCFSAMQAMLVAKAGGSFVSPFVGRVDDIGYYGMDLISDIKTVYNNYGFKTEIIVASIRNPIHVLESAKIGADVATIPFSIIKQLFKNPLTDIGVERFLKDWEKIPS